MKYRIRCHCGISMNVEERVICPVCQKDCAASRKGYPGDGTGPFYPRRHKHQGATCEGCYERTDILLTLCRPPQ